MTHTCNLGLYFLLTSCSLNSIQGVFELCPANRRRTSSPQIIALYIRGQTTSLIFFRSSIITPFRPRALSYKVVENFSFGHRHIRCGETDTFFINHQLQFYNVVLRPWFTGLTCEKLWKITAYFFMIYWYSFSLVSRLDYITLFNRMLSQHIF